MNIKILYEDRWLLVCEKPAGLPVQTASLRSADLTDRVRRYLTEKQDAAVRNTDGKRHEDQTPYLGVVHRLDQPVRGLVVFALTKEAAAQLSGQFTHLNGMEKTYLALVDAGLLKNGMPGLFAPGASCILDQYLLRDSKQNMSCVVRKGTPGAKHAVLEIGLAGTITGPAEDEQVFDEEAAAAAKLIFHEEAAAYREARGMTSSLAVLRIRLMTGRHHQIRAQLAHAGIPILGDRKYGTQNRPQTELRKSPQTELQNGSQIETPDGTQNISRNGNYPALCAWKLGFTHPYNGERLCFCFGLGSGIMNIK